MEEKTLLSVNSYRVTEKGGCSDCPFRDNGKVMRLRSDRVNSIKEGLLSDDWSSFTCHKTIYDKDTHEAHGKKMCGGAYEFLKREGRPNIMMRLAYMKGEDSPDES